MATYTGKTLDQYKSDYEAAQQEYNNLLQGSGGRTVSLSTVEYAKKKMDLAATDYGQAERMQNTSTTPSPIFGTIETPLLNECLAKQQMHSKDGQSKNSFATFGTIETPVLDEYLANRKAANPVNNLGYTSQRLENGMAFNSLQPVTTDSTRNYLGDQDKTANSLSATQLFNELNTVKPFASNEGLNPLHIINTSTPIFNPAQNSTSKAGTPSKNANNTNSLSSDFNSSGVMDNMANTGASSQNLFRGGYGNIVNADTYRTAVDQSIIDADTADLKSLKSVMTEAYSHYDTLRAGQSFAGAYGIHIAGQEAQTNDDIERAYQTYLAAEKAYSDAAKIHSDAQMAKAINTDAATLNQLESVKSNVDFAQKSAQGKLENHKLFDNYAPSTGTLKRGQTIGAGGYDSIDYMTPNEQSVYAYLLSTDKAKAAQYKDALTRTLNYRSMSDYQTMVKEQSDKNSLQGVLYNALGNAEKPFALVGTAEQTISNLVSGKSEPLDTNSGYFIGNQTADTSGKALVDKAKTPSGKWWTSQLLGVFNTVPVVAASLVNPDLGLAIMSSEAAGDAAYSVAERGGTAAQATTSGVIVGGMQYLLGKMPIGKLNEIKNATSAITVKSVLNDYGKQYLPLATMNVMSVYANNLTDQMVMGNKSAINEYIKRIEAQGMSEDEAIQKAITEFYGKRSLTALGNSAFQSAVFTGGAEVFKGINNPNSIKAASPATIIPDLSKESPQLSKPQENTSSGSTLRGKTDEERLLDIYRANKAATLLKTYEEYLKTNSFDQNKTEVYNEGAGDYSSLAEKARNVDVSTSAHQAVYYSGKGNRARAEAFAELNGKTTLEMTPGGRYFDSLKLFENGSPVTKDQAYEIWKILSERYAKSASGNVYGFVKGSFPESIFNTVEYPALQRNPYITNIFTELLN